MIAKESIDRIIAALRETEEWKFIKQRMQKGQGPANTVERNAKSFYARVQARAELNANHGRYQSYDEIALELGGQPERTRYARPQTPPTPGLARNLADTIVQRANENANKGRYQPYDEIKGELLNW